MHPADRTARTAGALYLVIVASGMFAQFFVRDGLTAPADPAAVAAGILAAEGLFRAAIAADLVMILSDVAIALAFYVLLRPVNAALALLAAFFRLMQAAVLAFNLLNLFFVLQLLGGGPAPAALGEEGRQALALVFLRMHGVGYTVALIFFALSLFVLGYLVVRSGYLPPIFGVALAVAALAYLVDGFALVLLPDYARYADAFGTMVLVPAFLAEFAFALWLLVRGVRTPRAAGAAPAAA